MRATKLDKDNEKQADRLRYVKPVVRLPKSTPFGLCKRDQAYEEHCKMLANQAIANRIISQQSTLQIRKMIKQEIRRQDELKMRRHAHRSAPVLALPSTCMKQHHVSPLLDMIKRERGI